ncbi:MAG: hypothetical protein ABIF82_15610 [Planctomycetota bacterium]
MKIEDLAYAIAGETIAVLEQKYHYRIPDEHKRDIQRSVQERLNDILTRTSQPDAEAAEATPAEEA